MSSSNWCEICKTQVYTTWLTSGIQDEGAPRNVLAQHHKKNRSNQPPKLARLSAAALHQANLKKHSQDNEHEEAPQESDDEGQDQGRAARHSKSTGQAKPDTMAYYKGTHWWVVLESPVQSGFLAFLAKTGTETSPSKLIHLEKLDRDRKRPQNRSLRSFCSL